MELFKYGYKSVFTILYFDDCLHKCFSLFWITQDGKILKEAIGRAKSLFKYRCNQNHRLNRWFAPPL